MSACVCGSEIGPFVIDREGETLCPVCAEDSRLCMSRTFGGACLLPAGHEDNHDARG